MATPVSKVTGIATGDILSDGSVPFTGAVTLTPPSNTSALTVASPTHTTSNPAINVAQTWNNVATTFTAILMAVTDTTSAAGSKLIDLLVGASSKFNVDKAGNTTIAGYLVTADGSVSAPAIRGADADSGIYFSGNNVRIACDGVLTYVHAAFYSYVNSGWGLRWSASSDPLGSADIGIGRNAAGVLEINTGSSGTFRDIKFRHEITTGVYATSAAAPTIASAGTIAPTVAITFISGTTTISTITAPSPISAGGGQITLIPTGLWATNTAGNIALATTAVVSKALTMTYDTTTGKWYPSY